MLKVAKNYRHVQPEFANDYYRKYRWASILPPATCNRSAKKPFNLGNRQGFDGSAVLGKFIATYQLNHSAIEFELKKTEQP